MLAHPHQASFESVAHMEYSELCNRCTIPEPSAEGFVHNRYLHISSMKKATCQNTRLDLLLGVTCKPSR